MQQLKVLCGDGGLSLANSSSGSSEEDSTLKRVVRETFAGMSQQFLPRIEATIISNCKANGHIEAANKLQSAYDVMKICIKKKTIFITPKNEYIAHIEECSKDSLTLTRSCLAVDQKYFPDFILDLVKSVVNFMYDDFDIMRVDLPVCIPRFNNYSVQRNYIQCLTDTAVQTHDTNQIPTSKASFCQKFIPASYCFTNMIKDTCDQTKNMDQFRGRLYQCYETSL
ncbi:hypothetical protein NQ314_012100 [Rhamnusium bicolor]|uniref:DUF19 domain-containing protein n=1 Tax=Rhamnusium bicolor TaxID=1586634 RepID=A0AAV8XEZ4_9CUCU|nr:hypothetical protein NQ314_012100 [Rhamnusium bicolor]